MLRTACRMSKIEAHKREPFLPSRQAIQLCAAQPSIHCPAYGMCTFPPAAEPRDHRTPREARPHARRHRRRQVAALDSLAWPSAACCVLPAEAGWQQPRLPAQPAALTLSLPPGTFDCPLGPWPSPSPPLPLPTLCCRAAEGGGCRPAPPYPRRQRRAARCRRELSIAPLSPHERPATLLHYPMPGWAGDCLRSYAIPGTQQAQRQPASRLQKQHGWLIWLVRMNHPFLQSAFCMC